MSGGDGQGEEIKGERKGEKGSVAFVEIRRLFGENEEEHRTAESKFSGWNPSEIVSQQAMDTQQPIRLQKCKSVRQVSRIISINRHPQRCEAD